MQKKKRVFVSGCYDILHAGHVTFFEQARALGNHLTVCFASDQVLQLYKGRKSAIPPDNKKLLIGSLKMVDQVVESSDIHPIFDFVTHIENIKPDIIAVTEDDSHKDEKKVFCQKRGIELVVLKKDNRATVVSTSSILRKLTNKEMVPLRVDFAGGWLDVPRFSRKGTYIVNCAIQPRVSLNEWPYEIGSGLGGSAAHAILNVKSGIKSDMNMGVGWQDPAVIEETGMCVWRSGHMPILEAKFNPDWLSGLMLIRWLNVSHHTPHIVGNERDYKIISAAGKLAKKAAEDRDIRMLAKAVSLSYRAQLKEGMEPLAKIPGALSAKYLGGGFGGYALYLFSSKKQRNKAAKISGSKIIEPYLKDVQ